MLIYCRVTPPSILRIRGSPFISLDGAGHSLLVLSVKSHSLDKNALNPLYPRPAHKPLDDHASPHIIMEKHSWLADPHFWPKVSGRFRARKIEWRLSTFHKMMHHQLTADFWPGRDNPTGNLIRCPGRGSMPFVKGNSGLGSGLNSKFKPCSVPLWFITGQ